MCARRISGRLAATLALALALAGCGVDDGYAVDLTVQLDDSISTERVAQVTRLHVDVTGAESWSTDVDAAGKFAGSRRSGLRYRPARATRGSLHLVVDAFANVAVDDLVSERRVASGTLDINLSGHGTLLRTLVLAAVDDMSPPPPPPPSCGDGTVGADERCDDGPGSPTPCPHSAADCDDQDSCTSDALAGSGCQAACTHDPIAASSACTSESGAAGVCLAASCCAGCVKDGECQPGNVPKSCGTAGNACFDCTTNSASSTCDAGACSGCDRTSCDSAGRSCGTSSCGFNCGSCPDSCANGMLSHLKCELTCQPNGSGPCPGNFVCASAIACKSSCDSDGDCLSGFFCNASKQCIARLANGGSCSRAGMCVSNSCADKVCCNATCGDTCEACDLADHLGTCWPVPSMQPPHTGHGGCTSDGSVCGGYCGGSNGSCTYPTGSCSAPPFVGSCGGGRCSCPSSSLFCAANASLCTSTVYNELACGTPARMCGGGTPACYASGCAAVATPTLMVGGFALANLAAIDAQRLYVADQSAGVIYAVSKQFSTKSPFVSNMPATPFFLVSDGANLYYGLDSRSRGSGSIWRKPIAGGMEVQLTGNINPWWLAIDSSNIYWSDRQLGVIQKMALSGGGTTVLTSSVSGPNAVASDGSFVYFAAGADGTVARVSVNGGQVQTIAANQNVPYGVALDAHYVYWSNQGRPPARDASVWKAPLAGGQAMLLLDNISYAQALHVDSNAVWVAVRETGIYKIPLCGGAPVLFANDPTDIKDLVIDSDHFYYVRETAADLRIGNK